MSIAGSLLSLSSFERPKSDYLIRARAKHVIQSWKNKGKDKILHTGLIPIYRNVYIGNNENEKGKLDFILIIITNDCLDVHFFLVKNRNPKNKTDFGYLLYQQIEDEGYFET
ncbi:MAG: hypothetical protein KL787_03435 [Taibaiella sp.]|nr:hypothetical protein [Taibaiella sp.]